MNNQSVDPSSPIWLLGDSPSKNFPNLPPLDPTHPSRHTIWTPILNVIQRELFMGPGCRLDDGKLFIRNAVKDLANKSNRVGREAEIVALRTELNESNPLLVLCFGQFSFECALWAVEEKRPPQKWKECSVPELGQKFSERIHTVQSDSVTLLPLLHAYVARQFEKCNQEFSGGGENYFEFAGQEIAKVLIENCDHPRLVKLFQWPEQKSAMSE